MNRLAFLQKVGANLRAARKAKSLSLRQLSAITGIDHSDLLRIEQGKVNISIFGLAELAIDLDVSISTLLDINLSDPVQTDEAAPQ